MISLMSYNAVVLNHREFNNFVGGYMEYWNLPPKDEREKGGKDDPKDIFTIPFGKNGMRIHIVSEPSETDPGTFEIFETDLAVYRHVKFGRSLPIDDMIDLKAASLCGEEQKPQKIYVIIVRDSETIEDLKLKISPYMSSNFDVDAHYGALVLG